MGDQEALLVNDHQTKKKSKFTAVGFASFASLFVLLVVIGLQVFTIITTNTSFPAVRLLDQKFSLYC